jgi:Putative addiction module component
MGPEVTMTATIDDLEAQVLQLEPEERARLARKLIASLDADPAVEEAWAVEVERRHAQIESGQARWLDGPDTLARLRARYR